jgi:hypothetical protein
MVSGNSVTGLAAAGACAGAGAVAGCGAAGAAAGAGGATTAGPPGPVWTGAGGAMVVWRAPWVAANPAPAAMPTPTAPTPNPIKKSRRVISG